jgi:hypothetical protein
MYNADSLRPGAGFPSSFRGGFRWIVGLVLGLLLLAAPLQATEMDDRYLKIYTTIQQADKFSEAGEVEKAKARYAEADKALREFKQRYPTWNTKLVAMRQNYIADQIAKLSRPAPAPEAEAEVVVAPRVAPGQPQVKLISAGAEPLEIYRLQAQPGSQQKVKMSVAMSMTMSGPDLPGEPVKIPKIQLDATVTTKSVAANQDITYEAVFDQMAVASDAGGEPTMIQALEQQLGGLKGAVVTGLLSDRYHSKKAEVKLPAGADASVRDSVEQMKGALVNPALVLPEEPIGVGAKWEIRTRHKENNINVDLVANHELVAAADGRLTIKSVTTRSAAKQKIANPLMPSLKVDLTKLTGGNTEEFVLDLAQLLPLTYRANDWTELSMAMNHLGRRETMTMKMEVRSELKSE